MCVRVCVRVCIHVLACASLHSEYESDNEGRMEVMKE